MAKRATATTTQEGWTTSPSATAPSTSTKKTKKKRTPKRKTRQQPEESVEETLEETATLDGTDDDEEPRVSVPDTTNEGESHDESDSTEEDGDTNVTSAVVWPTDKLARSDPSTYRSEAYRLNQQFKDIPLNEVLESLHHDSKTVSMQRMQVYTDLLRAQQPRNDGVAPVTYMQAPTFEIFNPLANQQVNALTSWLAKIRAGVTPDRTKPLTDQDTHRLFASVSQSLHHRANPWYQSYMERNPKPDWDHFCREFRKQFEPRDSALQYVKALTKLKVSTYGGDMSRHISEFKTLISQEKQAMSDDARTLEVRNIYLLRESVSDHKQLYEFLKQQKVKTLDVALEQLGSKATAIATGGTSMTVVLADSQPRCQHCRGRHKTSECRSRGRNRGRDNYNRRASHSRTPSPSSRHRRRRSRSPRPRHRSRSPRSRQRSPRRNSSRTVAALKRDEKDIRQQRRKRMVDELGKKEFLRKEVRARQQGLAALQEELEQEEKKEDLEERNE